MYNNTKASCKVSILMHKGHGSYNKCKDNMINSLYFAWQQRAYHAPIIISIYLRICPLIFLEIISSHYEAARHCGPILSKHIVSI